MTALRLTLIALTLSLSASARAQNAPVIPLWKNGAPGFEARQADPENVKKKGTIETSVTNVHNPSLTVYLPSKGNPTAAIVICPGGGHSNLAIEHEGHNIGKWLADHGVAGFVLKYRLAREKGSPYKIDEHALQDGQRAVRLVRSRAKEWGINPSRVGMMGFSAGGEVTALVCNNPDKGKEGADDPVEREGCRPDYQALV